MIDVGIYRTSIVQYVHFCICEGELKKRLHVWVKTSATFSNVSSTIENVSSTLLPINYLSKNCSLKKVKIESCAQAVSDLEPRSKFCFSKFILSDYEIVMMNFRAEVPTCGFLSS